MADQAKPPDPEPRSPAPPAGQQEVGLRDPRYESGPWKNELEDVAPAAPVPEEQERTRLTDPAGPAQHRHTTVDPRPRNP